MLIKKTDGLFTTALDILDVDTALPDIYSAFPKIVVVDIYSDSAILLGGFKPIVDQCKFMGAKLVFEGTTDPTLHKYFSAMLKYCREAELDCDIVLSSERLTTPHVRTCKEYEHNVFLVWNGNVYRGLWLFEQEQVMPGIVYHVTEDRLRDVNQHLYTKGDFYSGIEKLVFRIVQEENSPWDKQSLAVKKFFSYAETKECPYIMGFDFNPESMDLLSMFSKSCPTSNPMLGDEDGNFIAYITSDLKMQPCRKGSEWVVDISQEYTIAEAWRSSQFQEYRHRNIVEEV